MPWKDDERRRAYERERYASNVAFVRQYKLDHGCTDCGYNAHAAALEFDHVRPHLRGIVGKQMGKTRKIILEEIERCEVVCANCHNIRGYDRGQHRRAAIQVPIG